MRAAKKRVEVVRGNRCAKQDERRGEEGRGCECGEEEREEGWLTFVSSSSYP